MRAVKATFETIGKDRLGRYLNLTGESTIVGYLLALRVGDLLCTTGENLELYVSSLGWTLNPTGVVSIPPNPDNQIKATITRENIILPRAYPLPSYQWYNTCAENLTSELQKLIAHSVA